MLGMTPKKKTLKSILSTFTKTMTELGELETSNRAEVIGLQEQQEALRLDEARLQKEADQAATVSANILALMPSDAEI